jgi:hypothetical protein
MKWKLSSRDFLEGAARATALVDVTRPALSLLHVHFSRTPVANVHADTRRRHIMMQTFATTVVAAGIACYTVHKINKALKKDKKSAAGPLLNSAFVFIKPHANTASTVALVKKTFGARGIRILSEGEITGEKIDADMLIDQHYYAIASKVRARG